MATYATRCSLGCYIEYEYQKVCLLLLYSVEHHTTCVNRLFPTLVFSVITSSLPNEVSLGPVGDGDNSSALTTVTVDHYQPAQTGKTLGPDDDPRCMSVVIFLATPFMTCRLPVLCMYLYTAGHPSNFRPSSTRVFRASGMVYPHEGFKRNKRLGPWLVIRCYYKYLFFSFLSGCFFDCFFSFDHYSGGVVLFWLT